MRLAFAPLLASAALLLAGCGGGSNNSPPPLPKTLTFEIHVKNGKPVGGIKRFTVKSGTPITIMVWADVNDVVSLPGFGKRVPVAAGRGPSGFHFDPTNRGKFVIELEKRKLQIGQMTVR